MSRDEDILKTSMIFLKLAGIIPHNYFITMTYGLIFTPISFTLVFLHSFLDQNTFEDTVELIETISSLIQGTIKLILFVAYKDVFKELLNLRVDNFWKIGKFGEEHRKQLKIYPDVLIKILKCFYGLITVSLSIALAKPFIIHELALKMWLPEGKVWFYVIVIYTNILAVYSYIYYIAFNIFFCTIYMDCITQFKLLKIAFTKMETKEDMGMCVEHHNFLHKFMTRLNEPFGIYLLFQYFFGLSIILMEMLMITDPSEDLMTKTKAIGFIVILYLELSLNYLLASMLRDESEELYKAIWLSKWHLQDLKYQQSIMFMIKMSQKEISIKAGKMLLVDREALINAVRTTFSMYTFLSATNQEVTNN